MSDVQIGINPLTWSNDDMRVLGEETPLEVCLAESREAGYSGVELGSKFPRTAATLGPILQRFDRQLVSGWYSSNLLERDAGEEIAALAPHLDLLKELGAKVMVYCEVTGAIHGQSRTPLSRRPRMREEQWQLFLPRLTEVADYLHSQGVAMAYHHHMGTVIQSAEDVRRLLAGTGDNVGLLLDTGHLVYAGGNPLVLIRQWGKRINHVHCKDLRQAVYLDCLNRDLSFLDAVVNGAFTVPGDGFLDYLQLTEELKRIGYRGWLVVEADQDPTVAPSLPFARKGFAHLRHCIDQSGL
ncbi:MAG: myo-inosose-2 dehydratase [Desulfopila sp.]